MTTQTWVAHNPVSLSSACTGQRVRKHACRQADIVLAPDPI